MAETSGSRFLDILVTEIECIFAALLAGAQYGVKIRLPHSFLMTFLFQHKLDWKSKLRRILKLVFDHASHLAAFATTYKTVLAVLKWISRHLRDYDSSLNCTKYSIFKCAGKVMAKLILLVVDGSVQVPKTTENSIYSDSAPPGHPERIYHSFIAGAVGGYFIWGRYSSVNYQILLYLSSRVIVGLGNRLLKQGSDQLDTTDKPKAYPFFAALIWALVMALYEESPDTLHPSLTASMHEIYRR